MVMEPTAPPARLGRVEEIWMQVLREAPELTDIPGIDDWLRRLNIEITADQNAAYAGEAFDPGRFPVVARLAFDFFQAPDVPELFVSKPVQSAFTTHVWFSLCHALIFRPCTAILVMHTRQEVRKKKKDTFTPIVAVIPELAASERVDGSETTAEEFRFGSGATKSNLYVGGGQSAGVLTSTAANIVILDECEQHKTVGDTTTINLARGRMTAGNQWRKLCAFSKPEEEAQFRRDRETGVVSYVPQEGTYMHAEYLSGNQLRYECRCPHCGGCAEPRWEHIRYQHCRLPVLPGLESHAGQWDKARMAADTYYQCPLCSGRIDEGEQKREWVISGRWAETPTAERKGKEMYPVAHPGRWSAQFSALTDIAFASLRWGALALRWIDAENDPVKRRAFWNEILGLAYPQEKSVDTTFAMLRRQIPGPGWNDPPPWNMKDRDGALTGFIPILSTQLSYVGITVDNQKDTIKYRVRAYGKDGRSYLLDYGKMPASPGFPDLKKYLDTQAFTTLDGVSTLIYKCYMDIQGSRWYDAIDFVISEAGRTVATAGAGSTVQTKDRVWPVQVNSKSGRPIYVIYFDHTFWAGRLYRDTIQAFDRKRHRAYAPAIYFAADTGDDYFEELMKEREVSHNGKRPTWEKITQHSVNDYGDCEKIGLIMDFCERACHTQKEGAPPDPDAP